MISDSTIHQLCLVKKNPLHSDVTIIYSNNREKKFQGHRLVLCSASEWFERASQNLKEANNQEMQSGHVEGLKALLQFAYTKIYTEIVEAPDQLALVQKQFQQHVHIFAVVPGT
jgi:hypothetical protein